MSKVRKRSLTPSVAESSEPVKKRRTPPEIETKCPSKAKARAASLTASSRKSRKDAEAKADSSPGSSKTTLAPRYTAENIKSLDISQLLDIGEGQKQRESGEGMDNVESNSFVATSDSEEEDEEDWEEVKMEEKTGPEDPVIPEEGVDVVLQVPELMKRKKKGFDLESHIKRQMNQVKRELQLLMHKVHALCWIAHLKFVNGVLNSEIIMGTALSLVSNKNLYPPKYADLNYLERILKWYHSTIALKEFTKIPKGTEGLSEELLYQFQNKSAFGKKYFVFMLIVLLRTLGLKTRLVMSFQVVPVRPKNIELYNSDKTKQNSSSSKTSVKTGVKSEENTPTSSYFKSDQKSPVKRTVTGEGNTPKSTGSGHIKSEAGTRDQNKIMKTKGAGTPCSSKNSCSGKKKVECEKPRKSRLVSKKGVSASENAGENESKVKGRSKKVLLEELESDDDDDDDLTSEHFKCSNKNSQGWRISLSNKKSFRKDKDENVNKSSPSSSKCGGKKRELASGKTPKLGKKLGAGADKGKVRTNAKDVKNRVKLNNRNNPKGSAATPKVKNETIQKANDSSDNDDDFTPRSLKKKIPQNETDRNVLSSDEDGESSASKKGVNQWIEVFLEAEEKWITVDAPRQKVHCVREIYARATHPVAYVVACNPNSTLKDVTKRYVPNWHSDTRKRRVDEAWWNETMAPYVGTPTAQDREEDEDINQQLMDKPLPATISEFKDHPLYALKRHLLKFEGIYPANAPTLGFIRGEAVYARECVVTLRSRDMWYKEARVVRLKEEPYKIVKARPKFDKMTGQIKKDLPLELYGFWQTDEYMPPIASDGKVPRNEYGNVDLFKPCMLPIGTVHLQIPALNRVAKKLGIDCAPAVVGFEFHSGASHPVTDGFVVCEEFKEVLLDAWNKEIDETDKRNEERKMKRVYGNWKRLIRGLLIREKLKLKYSFGGDGDGACSKDTAAKKKSRKN